MAKGEKVYYKRIDKGDTEYIYYIEKDEDGEYYVVIDVTMSYKVTPTLRHVWDHRVQCLKISPEEVEKIKQLLEKGVELFEEEYGNREWVEC